eukprot:254546-Pelagomonas_calceolata.AAC.3
MQWFILHRAKCFLVCHHSALLAHGLIDLSKILETVPLGRLHLCKHASATCILIRHHSAFMAFVFTDLSKELQGTRRWRLTEGCLVCVCIKTNFRTASTCMELIIALNVWWLPHCAFNLLKGVQHLKHRQGHNILLNLARQSSVCIALLAGSSSALSPSTGCTCIGIGIGL